MQFDMGLQGLGILLAISVGFGILAQLIWRDWSHWLWLAAGLGWFIGGLFASEVVWATATSEELQPIIDGLAFDEALLGGLIGGLATLVAASLATGHGPIHHRPTSA